MATAIVDSIQSNGAGLMKHDLEAALKQAAGCSGGVEVRTAPRFGRCE